MTILSYGSRGDVQPFIALGRALRHVGHRVRVVAPPNFAALAQEQGLDFRPAGVDLQAHLGERLGALPQSGNALRTLRGLRDELRSIIDDVARDTWAAAQGSELIIGVGPASASVAEKLGAPFIEAALQPFTPTGAFPSPVAPRLPLGGGYNYFTHVAFERLFWQLFRVNTNRMRTQVLGLPPYPLAGPMQQIRERGLLRLHAYSAHVAPRPADWLPHHQVTGYWFLPAPAGWQPPEALRAFLAAGPPPVYVGFGSMMARNPQQMTALVAEALARSGQRAVLAGGWGALDGAAARSETLCFVDGAPHHWLFPRMAAIVHHGGAGTTGAALRSGVPSVVVPFGFDQAFWGQRVAALGVGPAPLPRATLTASGLAGAIDRAVRDPLMGERAARLGAQIELEHGTARAIDLIHRALGVTSIA